MLISTRGRYALRVMLDLADNRSDGYIAIKKGSRASGIIA